MDLQDLIQIIPIVLFILFWVLGSARRKRPKQPEPEIALPEEEMTLPPWGNFPMEEEPPQPAAKPEPAPPAVQPPPIPKPRVAPAQAPPRESQQTPTTIAGIPLSPQTFRDGIILSEILGRPKSLRRPPQ